jgi:hypothetical protein
MASTKKGLRDLTYAQNSCCGAASRSGAGDLRYQSNSVAKLLIYIASSICFFCGHFKESLDLQGFRLGRAKLSTKLSTENLEICKAPKNQALSAFFECGFADLTTITYV